MHVAPGSSSSEWRVTPDVEILVRQLCQRASVAGTRALHQYLLHYQQYNAPYSSRERRKFSYPPPFLDVGIGYFRTSREARNFLLCSWVQRYLYPLLSCNFRQSRVRSDISSSAAQDGIPLLVSTHSIIRILPLFLRDSYRFEDATSGGTDWISIPQTESSGHQQRVVVLPMLADEMQAFFAGSHEWLVQRNVFGKVLYVVGSRFADVTLVWGGRVDGAGVVRGCGVQELLGRDFEGLIQQVGSVPSREALHAFVAAHHPDHFSTFIGQPQRAVARIRTSCQEQWTEFLAKLQGWAFDDRGRAILAQAILVWNQRCFGVDDEVRAFAAPLLVQQVIPWCSQESALDKWAKGYQNLCEIVKCCVDAFPDRWQDKTIDVAVSEIVPPYPDTSMTTGLFPYAMTAVFEVVQTLIGRQGVQRVSCTSQSYHETMALVRRLCGTRGIGFQEASCLREVEGNPDVLVTDLHPNCPTGDVIYYNDLLLWIEPYLEQRSTPFSLVIDLTLNHLGDSEVFDLIRSLQPFVAQGRLEIYVIQSLAKLVQLGADNFSGGLCVYVGPEEPIGTLPDLPAHDLSMAKFYGLLFGHHGDLIQRYIKTVRSNVAWFDRRIREVMRDQSIWSSPSKVMEVVPNGDEETVYVSFSFKNLIKSMGWSRVEGERAVKALYMTFSELAWMHGLPLTRRPSFGFSLSNISPAGDSIRFSLGIEEPEILGEYVTLWRDFGDLLALYVSRGGREISQFDEGIKAVMRMAQGNALCPEYRLPYYDEFDALVGEVGLAYSDGQLSLRHNDTTISSYHIWLIGRDHSSNLHRCRWTFSDHLQLLFRMNFLRDETVHVYKHRQLPIYCLGGVCRDSAEGCGPTLATVEGHRLSFKPDLSITVGTTTYQLETLYVVHPDFGDSPISLARLDQRRLHEFYQEVIERHVSIDSHEGGIRLNFTHQQRHTLNYWVHLARLYSEGGVMNVVNWLNTLDSRSLLPSHLLCWQYKDRPSELLAVAVWALGATHVREFNAEYAHVIFSMVYPAMRKAIVSGLFHGQLASISRGEELSATASSALHRFYTYPEIGAIPDGKVLRIWINRIAAQLHAEPGAAGWLAPWIFSLMPVIQHEFADWRTLCETGYSVSLRTIARLGTPNRWLEFHLNNLETLACTSADRIDSVGDLTYLIQLYLHYPLSNENRDSLARRLKSISHEMLTCWIEDAPIVWPWDDDEFEDPNDYLVQAMPFCTEPQLPSNLRADCFGLKLEDRDRLRELSKVLDFEEALMAGYESESILLDDLLAWGVMTNSDSLLTFAADCLTRLQDNRLYSFYADYLDDESSVQQRLKEVLASSSESSA